MSASVSQELDPLRLPLQGERLIEASAGTGKTYTIAILYLRLLLGHGVASASLRPLTVEEILVVTFTEAATAELRHRIRNNIHQLRVACIRGSSDSDVLARLLEEIEDKAHAASLLLAAEQQMDEAAIFTIHGFCQRMLNLNAFESGVLFEQRLIQDQSALLRRAVEDFWRRYCYSLPADIAGAVVSEWSSPAELLKHLSPWLQGEIPEINPPVNPQEDLCQRHQQIICRIDEFKQIWIRYQAEIQDVIDNSDLNRQSYKKNHLANWLAKISAWAESETCGYSIPKADLSRFQQQVLIDKTKSGGEPPRHRLFEETEAFLEQSFSLRDLLITRALQTIMLSINSEKRQQALLGFDDLLNLLDIALQQPAGTRLASTIRGRFPAALIDEFQDTDPQQYRIFHTLYSGQPDNTLLLIGDPKQAIYAFRGADIFTYMQARASVNAHYSMDTNWRSSPAMISSVNRLFSLSDRPFLFSEIPFQPVNPAGKNQALAFHINGQRQPAMHFWLQPGDKTSGSEYKQVLARQCAAEICRWLQAGQRGEARIGPEGKQRDVRASDITVLVRDRNEANAVRQALRRVNIPSVYLSSRDSVFTTTEARELLLILQAVLVPDQQRILRSSLATSIMGVDSAAIEQLSQSEQDWDRLVDEFTDYRRVWIRRGVLPMLRDILRQRQIAETLLASEEGERRLTDILHIGELLQEAAGNLEGEHALVRWLSQQINYPDHQASNQQLRLESDRHLVNIVTIHKSKGQEFPLVWLPFAASFRETAEALYHDRHSYRRILDLTKDAHSLALAEEERLAEDLRLLYVALTRSTLHCSIGIAPLIKGNRKTQDTDLHKSALGYLIQHGEATSAAVLKSRLAQLTSDFIWLTVIDSIDDTPLQAPESLPPQLNSQQIERSLYDYWRITSYSGLQQHNLSGPTELLPRFDMDAIGEKGPQTWSDRSPHTFPRGASPGTFLHSLFEELDFTRPPDLAWLQGKTEHYGLEEAWLPVLHNWLVQILATPLGDTAIQLNQLSPNSYQSELSFLLPITSMLTAEKLDELMRQFDPLSRQAPALEFQQIQGMLKGFIDLVFCYEGKYYVLDYKSNWLGETAQAYTPDAMEQAMIAHRYDLQYQLYSLALHRYLRHRLPDYSPERHLGGVFYLFLRGMNGEGGRNGVFHTSLPADFIRALDTLFAGTEGKIA